MAKAVLDFEKPIIELEAKLEEMKNIQIILILIKKLFE